MTRAYEKLLLDSELSLREGEFCIDAADLGLGKKQDPYFRVATRRLHGGKQEGVEVVEIDNGRLELVVVPTRGMHIEEAYFDGVRIGWESPVEEIVHPAYVNLYGRGGAGWLEGMSGWVVRCGMCNNGAPYNVDSMLGGTLHGKLDYTPASRLSVSVGLDAPHEIAVRGAVREVCFFQENFLFETEIVTVPGADWFAVRDRVTNLAGRPAAMQMLYHNNYGSPLVGPGARVSVAAHSVSPRDKGYPAADIRNWDVYGEPVANIPEQCYYFRPKADRKGITAQMLCNADGDFAVMQSYPVKSLPCFTLWKNPCAIEDGYVTGLEPGTNHPNIKPYEVKRKRAAMLKPGAAWDTEMTFSFAAGRKGVAALDKRIKAIQGARKPELIMAPEAGLSPAGD